MRSGAIVPDLRIFKDKKSYKKLKMGLDFYCICDIMVITAEGNPSILNKGVTTMFTTIISVLLIGFIGFWAVMGTILLIPSKAEWEELKRLTNR